MRRYDRSVSVVDPATDVSHQAGHEPNAWATIHLKCAYTHSYHTHHRYRSISTLMHSLQPRLTMVTQSRAGKKLRSTLRTWFFCSVASLSPDSGFRASSR